MNFDEYPMGKLAFQLFYLGHAYQGLATQIGFSSTPDSATNNANTVEDCLLRAFEDLRLIRSRAECEYSRCGRTDSGVSAISQVFALKVRLSNTKSDTFAKQAGDQLDHVGMLNKKLPEDIRILGWSPVPSDFNARFSCTARQYHYFFSATHVDTSAMQQAAILLVGEHDFFNLHVIDQSKPAGYSCTRTVQRADIIPIRSGFHALVIRANGFLYHQIRCIMSILFSIGRNEHPVDYISHLLTAPHKEKAFGSLNMRLADPHGLVFSDADYGDVDLQWNSKSPLILTSLYEQLMIKSFITDDTAFPS